MVARPAIVFVYNADSGLFNTLTDIAHKIFSPQTYECNLCAITYGNFAIRKEWQAFLETLAVEMEFLHRDELQEKYAVGDVDLPVIFTKSAEGLQVWITAEEINRCQDLEELKAIISARLLAADASQG